MVGRPKRGRGGRRASSRGKAKKTKEEKPPSPEEEEEAEESQKTDDEASDESVEEVHTPPPPRRPGRPPKAKKGRGRSVTKKEPKSMLGKRSRVAFEWVTPPTDSHLPRARLTKRIGLSQHMEHSATVATSIIDSDSDSDEEEWSDDPVVRKQRRQSLLEVEMADWLEKALQQAHEEDSQQFTGDQSKAHLSVEERLRYEFVHGTNLCPADDMSDIKPSLIIKLFPDGFCIDDQNQLHPYNADTNPFLRAIDCNRMPPDLLELLEEIPCYYYDGCLLVSLHDYRFSEANPQKRNVLLRPDPESITYEIERALVENEHCKEEDLIEAERIALQSMRVPVCLDPSPRVFLACNVAQFDQRKFTPWNQELVRSLNPPESGTRMPTIYYDTLHHLAGKLNAVGLPQPSKLPIHQQQRSLLNLMHKRNPTLAKPTPAALPAENPPASVATPPATTEEKNEETPTTPAETEKKSTLTPPIIPTAEIPYDPSTAIILEKTSLRFSRASGAKFIQFELDPGEGMGYNATLRMGDTPDTGDNGAITHFTLRDTATVNRFINQLINTMKREGGHLVTNDAEIRKPAANLRPAPGTVVQRLSTQNKPRFSPSPGTPS